MIRLSSGPRSPMLDVTLSPTASPADGRGRNPIAEEPRRAPRNRRRIGASPGPRLVGPALLAVPGPDPPHATDRGGPSLVDHRLRHPGAKVQPTPATGRHRRRHAAG